MSVLTSIPQNELGVKTELYQENRAELLRLADLCLERHNDAWAHWLATGDHRAFLAAMAAKADRADLLGEVGYVT